MIFFARQAGSARALSPVIRRLLDMGVPRARLCVLASAQAAEVWRRDGLLTAEVASLDEARSRMDALDRPQALVTGTSIQAEADGAFWRWAREHEVPSLAYVDSWVNYAERFGGFRHLPDEIAVIDEPAREGVVSLGAPPDRVHVVGNPAFDALNRLANQARADAPAPAQRCWLWVGEGLSTVDWPQGARPEALADIDEAACFQGLLTTISAMEAHDRPDELWIAPHPRESPELYGRWLDQADELPVTVRILRGAGRPWAAQATVVVGMSSMLLVESARMGIPVVSLQLGRSAPSPVVDRKEGIHLVHHDRELMAALKDADTLHRSVPAHEPQDTERFVDLLVSLAGPQGESNRARRARPRAARVREGWMEQRARITRLKARASRVGGIVARLAGDRAGDLLGVVGLESPWITSCYSAIDQWFSAAMSATTPPSGRRIAVYHLRNRYWAEWSAYCCCRLKLLGHEPVLVYSERVVSEHLKSRAVIDPNARGVWRKLLANDLFQTVNIDPWLDDAPGVTEVDRQALTLSVQMSIAYDEGREFTQDEARQEALLSEHAAYAFASERLAEELRIHRAIVPSGIVGATYAIMEGFRRRGLDVVTVEAWNLEPRHMSWNLNRPTFHFDYGAWLEAMDGFTAEQEAFVQSFIDFQEDPSSAPNSYWSRYRIVQPAAADDGLPQALERFLQRERPVVLLGTNVIGDSATLGREIAFDSQFHWLEKTLEWFRAHPEYELVVRVHPGEVMGPCPMPLMPWLKEHAGDMKNVCLVGPELTVNTYAIGRRVNGGLLYVSNLGSDLVARRVPVIAVGKAPYHGLGIAHEPQSPEAYFEQVAALLEGRLPVTEQARRSAFQQIYVLTRLISLPGRPTDGRVTWDRIEKEGGDAFEAFYQVLSGDMTRSQRASQDRVDLESVGF